MAWYCNGTVLRMFDKIGWTLDILPSYSFRLNDVAASLYCIVRILSGEAWKTEILNERFREVPHPSYLVTSTMLDVVI